ncbi:MAG: hypothetical protein M1531_05490 [Chloroflexi bacterium]|nr:hypothetical protein [Chloroflexota bacterium]
MPEKKGSEIHEARGIVVLTQEDRFRLQTDEGRSLLLILNDKAGPSPEDMESLTRSRQRVRVLYRGEPDAGAVALQVKAA